MACAPAADPAGVFQRTLGAANRTRKIAASARGGLLTEMVTPSYRVHGGRANRLQRTGASRHTNASRDIGTSSDTNTFSDIRASSYSHASSDIGAPSSQEPPA
ncbi:hypothetical protein JCM17478_31060 [Thermopirellula anaerolimosa]